MKKLFKFLVAVFMGFALTSCSITIRSSLNKVELNKEAITLEVGQTTTLTATIKPEELASETTIVWSSLDEKVASVNDKGLVTALKEGTTKIKVTAIRGAVKREDTCTVKVVPSYIPVSGVTLNKQSGSLKVGESLTLVPTVLPDDATNKEIVWASSNESVAAVVDGIVTAISYGTATITVTTVSESKSASFELSVYQTVTGVTLDKVANTINVGESFTLKATVNPEIAQNKEVTWSTSNPHVASVNNGLVTAISSGSALITVTTKDGNYKAICYVTVVKPVTGVTLDSTSLDLIVNEETTLVATVSPSDATNKEVVWASSNSSIVNVDDGKVKALAPGNAVISVITLDGQMKATCNITVTQPVAGVSLNKEEVTIKVDEELTLLATVSPSNATNKDVTWKSSNENVASVNNGLVTAHKDGTVTITVSTVDGSYKDICVIHVIQPVESVSLDKQAHSLNINSSVQLEASILPEDATNKNVTWSSSDETVAFVNNRGLVVGLRVGSATITVTTKDGNHKATCLITVEKFENEITSENINVTYGESYEVEFDAISNIENAEIKYYKGLREISKPTDAGTYKVVITVPESATYKKASLEVSLVIAKRELIVEIDNQEVTYGDDEEAKTYELIAGEKAFNHKDEDVFEVVRSEGDNAGTYDIYVEIINDNYTVLFEKASYVINPKVVVKPTAITGLVYNNELLEGVKDNEGYSVEDGFAIEADTHIAYVSLDSKQNYVWEDGTTSDLEIEYVIALRQIEVVIDDQEVTYGDDEETLTYTLSGDLAKGHEDEDVFEIVRVSGDNAGEYEISLSQLNDNYNITSNTATYTINKYEIKGISFEDKVVEYDGEAHKLEIQGTLPEGVEVTYTPANEYTEKGVYDIEASFVDTTGNYIVPSNMEATLEIYVSVKGISLNETSLRLDPTDSYTLVATLDPINPTNDEVIWTSSNEDVVTVDQDGKLVALKVGNAVITVTTLEGNFKATCNVEVSILPESVEITNEEELLTTDVLKLNAVVYPLDATNQNLIWTSSDTNIATVDNRGIVTPVEPGFVTITVKTVVGNYEDEITIEVIQLVEEITLNRAEASIVETYNLQLIATINPIDTTNKSVVWSSSNETVATVDQNGLVEALSEGTTTITVKTLDGTNLSATCVITVTKLPVHAETVTIERTDSGTVLVDENVYLKAVVEPVDITDTITWTSSDETVACVSQAGVVTALSSGTVTITAYVGKDTIYEKKATYEVEIFKHATNIFGLNNLEITYGTTYEFDPIASSGLMVDVKYYEGSTLLDEKPVNAGTYKVVASVISNYKYEAKEVEATLTINKVKLEKPLANENNTFIYNKEAHTYTLLESAYYTISNNSATDAGRYEAVVSIKNTVNYEWADGTNTDLLYEFVINKAKVETPTANTGLVYNGLEQTGVNEDERYTIKDGKATIAGTHIAKVTLKDNYEWLDSSFDGYVMWTIEKATYDMSKVAWVYEGPYTYNKAEQGVTLTGLPKGVTVRNYINASATNAGTYTARVELQYDSSNYYPVSVDPITWEIKKVKLDMQDVAWDYDGNLVYNGNAQTVTLVNVPNEITVTYDGNTQTNAGENYTASATFEYDKNNYVLANNNVKPLAWKIAKADLAVQWGDALDREYTGDISPLPLAKVVTPKGDHIDFEIVNKFEGQFKNVGTYNFTVGGFIDSEEDINNYNLTNTERTIKITPITLEVVWTKQDSYTYGKDFVAPSASVTTLDKENGEFVVVILTPTITSGQVEFENAGTYDFKVEYDNNNYTITNTTLEGIEIGKAQATLDGVPTSVEIELGEDFERNVTTNSTKPVVYTIYDGEEVVNKIEITGTYTVKVSVEESDNYTSVEDDFELIVVKSATGVTLDKSTLTMKVGEEPVLLEATVLPDNATNKKVTWESDAESVATVEDGLVTAVSPGSAIIIVTTVDGNFIATCSVLVEAVNVTGVTVEPEETQLKVGSSATLTANILPDNATNKEVTWKSSNEKVATVDGNKVTAVASGYATITATTVDGEFTDTCEVIVMAETTTIVNIADYAIANSWENAAKYEEIDMGNNISVVAVGGGNTGKYYNSGTNWRIYQNEDPTVTISADSCIISTVKITYTSDKTGVLTFGGNNVESNSIVEVNASSIEFSVGNTTDSVENGQVRITNIEVTYLSMPLKSLEDVSLDKSSATIELHKTLQLIPTFTPSENVNKNVTWISSKEDVATVEDGLVTAVGLGTTTITVITEDGELEATCEITVIRPSLKEIKLDVYQLDLVVGNVSDKIIATADPEEALLTNAEWHSENIAIATVVDGVVTAVGAGTTQIVITVGSISATCVVNVTAAKVNVTGVTVEPEEIQLKVGASTTLTANVLPDNATNKEVTWKSSNEKVATVDEAGKVTAVASGYATITATTVEGSFIDSCEVVVLKATPITLNIADYADEKGWTNGTQYSTINLDSNITVEASGGGNTGKYYTSGEQWRLYGSESASLTISSNNNIIASVKVIYDSDSSGTLWFNSETISSGEVVSIYANSVTFDVRNTSGATSGQARVTDIEVTYLSYPQRELENLNFDNTKYEFDFGSSLDLNEHLVFTPSENVNKDVIWDSSNKTVATVNNGVVTPVGVGTTTITVTSSNGEITTSCQIEITPRDLSEVELYDGENKVVESLVLKVNEAKTFNVKANPSEALLSGLTWTNVGDDVITYEYNSVNQTLRITAKAITGEAELVVSFGENEESSWIINVIAGEVKATSIEVDSSVELNEGNGYANTATVTVKTDEATNKSFTVTGYDSNLILVSIDGNKLKISANKTDSDATTTITVTTADGSNLTAECKVVIVAPEAKEPELFLTVKFDNQTPNSSTAKKTVSEGGITFTSNSVNKMYLDNTPGSVCLKFNNSSSSNAGFEATGFDKTITKITFKAATWDSSVVITVVGKTSSGKSITKTINLSNTSKKFAANLCVVEFEEPIVSFSLTMSKRGFVDDLSFYGY